MNIQEKIQQLIDRRVEPKLDGGEKRIEAQHLQSKNTAWERINMLLDEGSFGS